jgi:hypothetical protein
MKLGAYFIEFDRTGFPLIRKNDWDFFISIFPVSKYQFESFLFENSPHRNMYTDEWYREKLKLNPRKEWWNIDEKYYELFLTGLTLREIEPFLRYLGDNFRLPIRDEWIKLYKNSKEIRETLYDLNKIKSLLKHEDVASPVFLWIEKLPIPLTNECVLEMLYDGEYFIGKPNYGLLPNLWIPEEIRSINWDTDVRKSVGFRILKEIKR